MPPNHQTPSLLAASLRHATRVRAAVLAGIAVVVTGGVGCRRGPPTEPPRAAAPVDAGATTPPATPTHDAAAETPPPRTPPPKRAHTSPAMAPPVAARARPAPRVARVARLEAPPAPAKPTWRLTLWGHRHPVRALAFDPDGRYLLSADQTEILVWDLSRGARVSRHPTPGQTITAIAAVRPGAFLVAAQTEAGFQLARMTRAGSQLSRSPLAAPSARIDALAVDPSGKTAAAATPNGIRLLDAATGRETAALKAPTKAITQVGFIDAGHLLASQAAGQVWRLATSPRGTTKLLVKRTSHTTVVRAGARWGYLAWTGVYPGWRRQRFRWRLELDGPTGRQRKRIAGWLRGPLGALGVDARMHRLAFAPHPARRIELWSVPYGKLLGGR